MNDTIETKAAAAIHRTARLSALAAAGFLALGALPVQADGLSLSSLKLKLDLSQTTVSGISSGAYMAGQFQVAFSDIVKGAGIVAGGPYACAEVSPGGIAPAVVALYRCMNVSMGPPDVDALVANAKAREKSKDIAPLANLAASRIYLFNGGNDVTVRTPVTDATERFYKALGVTDVNFSYVKNPEASHAFITDGYGAACGFIPKEGQTSEYLNNCQYDQAGAIVQFFYADAKIPNAPAAAKQPAVFDQRSFIGDPSRSGMAKTGYIYVPEACADGGQTCRVHVAFHGCKMSSDIIGDHFAVNAGYNRWADVNNIVVLYPQIDGGAKPTSNPNACWDWFAYTGYDFARRSGFQMTAVRKMLAALTGQ